MRQLVFYSKEENIRQLNKAESDFGCFNHFLHKNKINFESLSLQWNFNLFSPEEKMKHRCGEK